MKRLMMLLVGVAALACLATVASAGDYHVGKLLVCSDCHIAHGSQSHGYATDDTLANAPEAAHAVLLRGETFSEACLTCHEGRGASGMPDVLGATDAPPANGRSAGALNVANTGAHGYSNSSGYSQGAGHTLWSEEAPPGSGNLGSVNGRPAVISAEGLQCTDCHRAHGSKYFRNMMADTPTGTATYIPYQWRGKEVSYQIGGALLGGTSNPWVLEKTAIGANHYDNDNVQFLEPISTTSAYGDWCATCHENFHGNLTAQNIEEGGEVIRHPTAGVDITTQASTWKVTDSKHRLKLMDNTGTWDGTSAAMSPTCFSCHKSHGNKNKFGLVFVIPQGDASGETGALSNAIDPRLNATARLASMTEEGDGGQYRDLCRNCHGQGRFPTGNPTNLNQ